MSDSRPVLDRHTPEETIKLSDLSPVAQGLYYKLRREGKIP